MSPRHPRSVTQIVSRFLLGIALFATFTPALPAVPLEHDLQQGLAYIRSTELATELPALEKKLSSQQALVLDLRRTAADAAAATALGNLLSHPLSAPRFARLVLVSRNTAPALLQQLSTEYPGVVIIAARTEGLTADISVGTTPEDDALAYDALTDGLALDKLLSGSAPQKIRYDEASLVRDHANGSNSRSSATEEADPEPSSLEPSTPEASGNAPALNSTKPSQHPVDRVLLRAVQLHRTLLALKKL